MAAMLGPGGLSVAVTLGPGGLSVVAALGPGGPIMEEPSMHDSP